MNDPISHYSIGIGWICCEVCGEHYPQSSLYLDDHVGLICLGCRFELIVDLLQGMRANAVSSTADCVGISKDHAKTLLVINGYKRFGPNWLEEDLNE